MQDSRYVQRSNLDRFKTEPEISKPKDFTSGNKSAIGRLFVLEVSGGRILSMNADGSDLKVIVSECRHPDGIVVYLKAGYMNRTTYNNNATNCRWLVEKSTVRSLLAIMIAIFLVGCCNQGNPK